MENFIFYAVIIFKYDITQKEGEVSLKMRQYLKVSLVRYSGSIAILLNKSI